jgi:hypothetical protein
MESSKIRVRVNLNNREFEVEGEQAIVFKNFGDLLQDYLNAIKKEATSNGVESKIRRHEKGTTLNNVEEGNKTDPQILPENFGEFFHAFPKGISNVDKLLAACFFVQKHSENKTFTVKEANDLLVQQGVKLSNPNAFNKANISTKRIFKMTGKNYRVSDNGMEAVMNMLH